MSALSFIPNLKFGESGNFLLISGPCAVESRELVFEIAQQLKEWTDELEIPFVFKASFRKANRSRLDSFQGIGDEKALEILADVRRELKIPVTTDIHTEAQAEWAAEVVDILQIPAFLCRQTSLLLAAARTGKLVNVKKGQFLSPESMLFVRDKLQSVSDEPVLMTERGTVFGYGDLVVDFRSFPTMNDLGALTIMDCTHSLQQPNQSSGVTGGRPELIESMAKAALAVGAGGLFIETHPDPSKALSDGANMLNLSKMKNLLINAKKVHHAVNTES